MPPSPWHPCPPESLVNRRRFGELECRSAPRGGVQRAGRSNRRLEIASVKCVACISGFEIRNRASDLDDSMPDAVQERAGNVSDADGEWCSACLRPFKYPTKRRLSEHSEKGAGTESASRQSRRRQPT